LTSLRNLAIASLRERNTPTIAAATREVAAQPHIALALLNAPASISA
jgi:hypothetical protein